MLVGSSDSGDYYKDVPSVTPDSTESTVTIKELATIYQTNPLAHKGINVRVNRIMGEGFELYPAEGANVDQIIAQTAVEECWNFLRKIDHLIFFRQSCINAMVAGNEWTEVIYNIPQTFDEVTGEDKVNVDLPRRVMGVAHGDFETIDFRRSLLENKILLDNIGRPEGYWQQITDLAELQQDLSMLYGSIESLENLKATKERLKETQSYEITDASGQRTVGLIGMKPNYIFLSTEEIVHLSFNNLNDNYFGQSLILAAYNAIKHLDIILNASAEMSNTIGYPKLVATVGDVDHPPTETLMDDAEALVRDPIRKESYAVPFYTKLEYLTPQGTISSDISSYADTQLTLISAGLKVPRELLTGEGDANRATSMQGSSDFEKDIETDRKILESYILQILNLFLIYRGHGETSGGKSPYLPRIEWPKWITEDDALKEKMVLEKWQAGLLTLNEARERLGENEIEDATKGESFFSEPQPDTGMSLGGLAERAESAESTEPDQEVKAEFALEPKAELNPPLNEKFRTNNIDYKKIAQENVGTKIKSVSKAKANKIRDIITNGLANNESLRNIRNQIQSVGDYNDSHTNTILRTEISNLKSKAKAESANERGMKFKQWIAVMDNKTSNLSKALHKQVRPIEEEFEATYKSGNKTVKWKGQEPPEHPNTRCSLIYYGNDPRTVGLEKSDEEVTDLAERLMAIDLNAKDIMAEVEKKSKLPKKEVDENLFGLLNLSAGADKIISSISPQKTGKLTLKEINRYTSLAKSLKRSKRNSTIFFEAAKKSLGKLKFGEVAKLMKQEGVK